MKTAGTIVLALGLLLGLVVAMFPTSVTIFEEEGSCGPPLLRVIAQQESDDPNEQDLIDLCEDQSADRLIVAGLLALGGVVVGGGLLLAARGRGGAATTEPPTPPMPPPPR